MEPLILYFIKVNVALAVLYGCYKLLSSKDTFFGLRRLMLILIYVTSSTYPLLHFKGWIINSEISTGQIVAVLYQKVLPEITVTQHPGIGDDTYWIKTTIYVLYVLGIGLLLMRTLLELRKTCQFIRNCQKTIIRGTIICLLPEEQEPYSFFRWVCLHPQKHTDREVDEILIHERTHVQELHSVDILLAQAVIILCWFNPFAWLMRHEIRLNHEYLADRQVVASGYDKKAYQYHLIGLEHTSLAAAKLYNNFSVLPLKKRIKMLNKKRTRSIMKSKYLMFIPVAALLIIFSSSNVEKNEMSKQIPVATEATEIPATQAKAELQVPVDKKIYEMVEVMPIYPGGETELLTYLAKNIKYPADAVAKKQQGKVIIQFVVNTDGSITDSKVAKSVTPSMDAEGMRVVNSMPKWTPGKYKGKVVRVKYSIPIMFKLQ